MSPPSSKGITRLRVQNALQDIAAEHPGLTVTASGMTQRAGVDVEAARWALTQAVNDGFLVPRLVARCDDCGSEQSIDDANEVRGAVCAGPCMRRTQHTPYVVFSFTPTLLQLAGERARPKERRRPRTPLLERVGRALIQISRKRPTR